MTRPASQQDAADSRTSEDPARTIALSRYFQADWYCTTYPDVAQSGMDPVQHYLHVGAAMGRDPGPGFSAGFYMREHWDVRLAGHNPLWHYELFGRDENRAIAPAGPLASIDTDLVASEIDRRRSPPPEAHAHTTLTRIFAQQQAGRPHRFMTEFDPRTARLVVDSLVALESVELIARRTRASVIMPTYNRAQTLATAIRSVLEQSHHDLELIVVDDGSTDETPDILAAHAGDPRLQVVQMPHGGVSAARNAGLATATGEVIFYLDSDNRWTRDFVRLMLMTLVVTEAQCAYSALRLHDETGAVSGYRGEPFNRAHCLKGNYVDLNVFCHHRDMYDRLGGFDPALRRMVDWDLVLRYTKDTWPVYCPFIGCLYADHKNDPARISTSRPYLFHTLVHQKHTGAPVTTEAALRALYFRVALKISDDTLSRAQAEALKKALEQHGLGVVIDLPEGWYVRHPHQEQVVLILQGAGSYAPNSEQINIVLGAPDEVEPAASQAHAVLPLPGPEDTVEALIPQIRDTVCQILLKTG